MLEELNSILRVISDAGVGLVSAGVLIIVFYKLVFKQAKENQQLLEHILECTPYSITPEKYSNSVEIDKEINLNLDKLREITHCARASLVTFHNGGKDLSGLSFLKMSMRNESTAPSIKPLQPDFQNVFRNTLAYWCNQISETGHCYIIDTEELKDVDNNFYDFLSTRGIVAKYGVSIMNDYNQLIGFICIEYTNVPDVQFSQIKYELVEKKNKIEAILNFANSSKITNLLK